MRSVSEFYDQRYWGWAFGKYGARYSIVYQRHIGLDLAVTGDIPALWSGRVIRVLDTGTMAWVVVLETELGGSRKYHSYCHLANDRLPRRGQWINRGERVGRVARGKQYGSQDDGGTAWDGPHLHLVIGGHPQSAYDFISGHRTLSAFTDPKIVISDVLAYERGQGGKGSPASTGKGPKPFPTPVPIPEEERNPIIMGTAVVYTKATADKDRRGAIIDTTSGKFSDFGHFPISYAHDLAQAFSGNEKSTAAEVTDGHFDKLRQDFSA